MAYFMPKLLKSQSCREYSFDKRPPVGVSEVDSNASKEGQKAEKIDGENIGDFLDYDGDRNVKKRKNTNFNEESQELSDLYSSTSQNYQASQELVV